eukprot:gb/GFBE01032565.1/.p1 GENE.gb/GFBE01032565.1/~~gb/GFBE01032565.1/.p1  ORF type:complete len:607 (+),score=123.85 gb/GFBE01032565.1/:1-1821(+)
MAMPQSPSPTPRSQSPTLSDGNSWEEVSFTQIEEDVSSDDGMVVVHPSGRQGKATLAASAASASLPCPPELASLAGADSKPRTVPQPALDARCSQGSSVEVQDASCRMLRGSRTVHAGANTAARILQAWWRTRNVPAIHLPDADEEDEVMSEELDEEEDEEDEAMQMPRAYEPSSVLADLYRSCKELRASMKQAPPDDKEANEAEPGSEPEAEAEAEECPRWHQAQTTADCKKVDHQCQEQLGNEGPKWMARPSVDLQPKQRAWAGLAWYVPPMLLGAVLALVLALLLQGATISSTIPQKALTVANQRTAQHQPEGLRRANTLAAASGNSSALAANLVIGLPRDTLATFEAMHRDIEAARRTAAAALREAMEAQSSWLAEAKARREAEQAATEALRQLRELREGQRAGSADGRPNATEAVLPRRQQNLLRRLQRSGAATAWRGEGEPHVLDVGATQANRGLLGVHEAQVQEAKYLEDMDDEDMEEGGDEETLDLDVEDGSGYMARDEPVVLQRRSEARRRAERRRGDDEARCHKLHDDWIPARITCDLDRRQRHAEPLFLAPELGGKESRGGEGTSAPAEAPARAGKKGPLRPPASAKVSAIAADA